MFYGIAGNDLPILFEVVVTQAEFLKGAVGDLLPPLSLSARSGGFSFKAGIPASISELSPRAPRFFFFVCNLCAASFHLFQHTPSFLPDIDCRIFVSIMIRQTPVAEPLTHIQRFYLRVDVSASVAYLARWIPSVYPHQFPAAFLQFVG